MAQFQPPAPVLPQEEIPITPTPYPATTKSETVTIGGISTTATSISFADKIMITISQHGRLAHWVYSSSPHYYLYYYLHNYTHYLPSNETILTPPPQVHVPLDISATDSSLTNRPYHESPSEDEAPPNSDLLPLHHLTATTILGGGIPELDVLGQTLATQIASAVMTRNERERRMVVVGLGLDRNMVRREEFGELVMLALGVL